MRELLLHLGIPKTGSTALQIFFARNYEALLASSVDYFRIGEFDHGLRGKIAAGNAVRVACSLLPDNHQRRIVQGERHFDEFAHMIERSPAERGLLSSELFASADPKRLREFLARLTARGVRVRAIYYIRRQDQILSSSYVQQVRLHGYTHRPDDYVRKLARHNDILRYHFFYRTMTGLFGDSNLTCRIYEQAVARNDGIFGDFLEGAGISGEGLSFAIPKVNSSIAAREVAMLLLLNRFRPRKQFVEMVVANADNSPTGVAKHDLLSRSLRAEIATMFRDENTKLARECFNRVELFAPDPLDGPEDPLASSQLTIEDLTIFLGGLLVRFDGRLSETGRIARAAAAGAGVTLRKPGPAQATADDISTRTGAKS